MILFCTLFWDFVLSEPVNRYHPVAWLGKGISWLEESWYADSRMSGVKLVGAVIMAVTILGWCIQSLISFSGSHLGLGSVGTVLLTGLAASFCIAPRGLITHLRPVVTALCQFRIQDARTALAKTVGRDTAKLSRHDICRAGCETLAEGLGDGVIAPLFWLAFFGLPGIFVYRAVNTLDSMVGYKNERYRHFGWCAARTDDLLNWLPARLAGYPALILTALFFKSWDRAMIVGCRDAGEHLSPNAGWYEATVAGLLGIRLGGDNVYQGKVRAYPVMNPQGRCPELRDILSLFKIIPLASLFAVLIISLYKVILNHLV